MVYAIGGFEVLGACGLYWKKAKAWSMLILIVISMGAILTLVGHHVKWLKDPLLSPMPALVILLSLFGIMYLNAKQRKSEIVK